MAAFKIFRKFADLLDRSTVDLPAINTPLADALAAKATSADLSTVATSGSYADLSGTPTIPSTVAELSDRTTYDFATLNTPLSDALAGKATAAQGALADTAVQEGDSPSFGAVTASGTVTGGTAAFAGGSFLSGVNLALRFGANVNSAAMTDGVRKFGRIGFPHFNTTKQDVLLLVGDSDGILNVLNVGGGSSSYNAVTDIVFFSAGTNATLSGTEKMRIKGSGNVGIGTSSPAEKLDVVGNIKASGTVTTGAYTVATLPTPTTGMRCYVTDSSVAASGNFGATVAAGGANTVPVFYDGTNWIIA